MFDGLDDPRKQMLLAMGLGLLGNQSGNVGKDIGNAGLLGLNAYNTGQSRKAKLAEEKQQAEMRAMQMAQIKQQQEAAQRQQQSVQQFIQSRPDLAQRYAVDPQGAMKAAFPDNKPISVKPGEMLLDPTTMQPKFKAPAQPKWLDLGDSLLPVDESGNPVGEPVKKNMAPGEARRLGMEVQRLGMDRARLGMEAGRFNYEIGDGSGLPQKTLDAIKAAMGKKQAEAQLTARQELPQVEAEAQQVTGLVDKLITHPGFKTSVGMKGPTGAAAAMGVPIPGTDAANWKVLRDQIIGKQFMQAYQTLKGGGQITEVEGKKATDAMARMDTSQSEEEFIKAANDFKGVINSALNRQRNKAGSGGWSIQRVN